MQRFRLPITVCLFSGSFKLGRDVYHIRLSANKYTHCLQTLFLLFKFIIRTNALLVGTYEVNVNIAIDRFLSRGQQLCKFFGANESVGSLYVFGKLPTYPSPQPTLTLTSHLGQNVSLGEG